MNEANPAAITSLVVWSGFVLALVFGYVGAKTNFCTMGAVSDIVNIGDWGRMRMWALAIGVAILGCAGLQLAGLIDVAKTIYTTPSFTGLSYIVGGFLFGIGMTLGSGCGSKTLIRIGGGNLKSLIVAIMMAIAAYMTLRGLFGVFRVATLDTVAVTLPVAQDIPSLLAHAAGATRATWLAVSSLVLGGGFALFALLDREFRTADNLLGGFVVGLVIIAAWYVSGHIGYIAEDPNTLEERFYATNSGRMEAFSFVSPQAYFLELLMLWSDKSRVVTFGIATALGVAGGSFLYALVNRSFRLESFRDADDLINHLIGGVLMGFGGVLALGCTIGQGLSGVSTLAVGSFIVLASIIAGSVATMKWQYWRMMRET